jgi:hypothetical protein
VPDSNVSGDLAANNVDIAEAIGSALGSVPLCVAVGPPDHKVRNRDDR